MASPSPEPSIVLVFLRSSLSKGSNNLSISSFLIPMPVSVTEMDRSTESSSFSSNLTSNSILPSSVYLTALVRRLVMICFTLVSSPIKCDGRSGSMTKLNSSPLASARNCTRLYRSTMTDDREYSSVSSSILPFSILEKSKMSLIIDKRLSPALLILSE